LLTGTGRVFLCRAPPTVLTWADAVLPWRSVQLSSIELDLMHRAASIFERGMRGPPCDARNGLGLLSHAMLLGGAYPIHKAGTNSCTSQANGCRGARAPLLLKRPRPSRTQDDQPSREPPPVHEGIRRGHWCTTLIVIKAVQPLLGALHRSSLDKSPS
jgi:hypothetical protein